MQQFDKIIIGAGLYGLYAALFCAKRGENVLVLEHDPEAFSRATYINQARVHMGYHYPRSYTTAKKSADYYDRFIEDYNFCIHNSFDKIYAISKNFSWTNAVQFKKFCADTDILCKPINIDEFFKEEFCEGAYLSKECTYDALVLKKYFLDEISKFQNVEIQYNTYITQVEKSSDLYSLKTNQDSEYQSNFILNTTYASVNQILKLFKEEPLKIKYELCEVILCKVSDNLKNVGVTMMDGPFFSLMPFGQTGYHSLTAVNYTPHKTCYSVFPEFDCQKKSNNNCSSNKLGNCNTCVAKPKTSWPYMLALAKKYLNDDIKIEYVESLYSIKPILQESEIDDSRPTVIKEFSKNPKLVSVLSGKINTVYDLDLILSNKE
ncbi:MULTISPECIES: FAD-dependent oxidoreductase [unclassified Flavobacterium]|nr:MULTISPECIES: FAD-dependent oxidoreductase [unclassified Flavobacterium]MQP51528.1 FAD-dependent oxidoreductase [Flavobacterium sp. LMO9]MQP61244.1 FAD-dependent oxidoreductase [Flavobacterium sp. LMO6]